MLGVEKESGTVCRFKARKSMVQLTVPSFFITGTKGEAHALAEGAMMPSAVQSASCFFNVSTCTGVRGLVLCLTGLVPPKAKIYKKSS